MRGTHTDRSGVEPRPPLTLFLLQSLTCDLIAICSFTQRLVGPLP